MTEEKKFRVNAKQFFLTYPQCDGLTSEELLSYLKQKASIVRYVIGTEKHEDGGMHLHAVIHYAVKLNVRRQDFFNCRDFHCNIQSVKSWSAATIYAMKDGNYISDTQLDTSDPTNYKKRKEDFEVWEADKKQRTKQDVTYPITLPDDSKWDPTNLGKKKSLWIVGAPDAGKTKWVQDTFEGKKVFIRSPDDKYPYETYKGESVIICDDFLPTFKEIVHMTQFYKIETKVYGATRYKNVYMPLKTNVSFIIISNLEPDFGNLHDAFLSRFNIVRL
jgi:hypothetical protein